MSNEAALVELVEGAWLHTSERFVTTTTVVDLGGGQCLVVDPAAEPADLAEIAGLVGDLGLEVALGWSTHPHWDHVLWSAELGAGAPRFATPANAALWAAQRPALVAHLEQECPGHDVELCGRLMALGAKEMPWPARCRVIEHRAHAPGHGALWWGESGLLVAGDMVSDVEVPLLDLESPDPVGEYLAALDLYEEVGAAVAVFVPGHGRPGDRDELYRRLAADRAYLSDLVTGRPSDDPRRGEAWLEAEHRRQVEWCRGQPRG